MSPQPSILLAWYSKRWRYVHAAVHQCLTNRYDKKNAFLWLALGPLDLRVHWTPRAGVVPQKDAA